MLEVLFTNLNVNLAPHLLIFRGEQAKHRIGQKLHFMDYFFFFNYTLQYLSNIILKNSAWQ